MDSQNLSQVLNEVFDSKKARYDNTATSSVNVDIVDQKHLDALRKAGLSIMIRRSGAGLKVTACRND